MKCPDAAPILLFDSGVGGLSVLRAVSHSLPFAPLVYVADNAGYPYGIKAEEEIAARVPTLLGRLAERFSPRLIVIACNTASTIALDYVRNVLDVPVVGTVPAIKPAALASKTRVIGVLGTEATIRQPYVDQLSETFASDCCVLRYGSAALVHIAEAKLRGVRADLSVVRHELNGLLSQMKGDQIDHVVLACTHFPLLLDELKHVASPDVHFVDGAEGIARRVRHLTAAQEWPSIRIDGVSVFTKQDPSIVELKPAFMHYGLKQIVVL